MRLALTLLLIIITQELRAQELRFPTLGSYLADIMAQDEQSEVLGDFFYIEELVSFIENCEEPPDGADPVLWGLQYLAALNATNDSMGATKFYLNRFYVDDIALSIPDVLSRASKETETEWQRMHAVRDALASTDDCVEEFDLVKAYTDAFQAFQSKAQPYRLRILVDRAINFGSTSRSRPDPADMRFWREESYRITPPEQIANYAMAVFRSTTEGINPDWAMASGSENRFLLVAHPEISEEDILQIANILAVIEGPFSLRRTNEPDAFGLNEGDLKAYAFGQEIDGTAQLDELDKIEQVFEQVAAIWRKNFY